MHLDAIRHRQLIQSTLHRGPVRLEALIPQARHRKRLVALVGPVAQRVAADADGVERRVRAAQVRQRLDRGGLDDERVAPGLQAALALEDRDGMALLAQGGGGAETGRASADDDDFEVVRRQCRHGSEIELDRFYVDWYSSRTSNGNDRDG